MGNIVNEPFGNISPRYIKTFSLVFYWWICLASAFDLDVCWIQHQLLHDFSVVEICRPTDFEQRHLQQSEWRCASVLVTSLTLHIRRRGSGPFHVLLQETARSTSSSAQTQRHAALKSAADLEISHFYNQTSTKLNHWFQCSNMFDLLLIIWHYPCHETLSLVSIIEAHSCLANRNN